MHITHNKDGRKSGLKTPVQSAKGIHGLLSGHFYGLKTPTGATNSVRKGANDTKNPIHSLSK